MGRGRRANSVGRLRVSMRGASTLSGGGVSCQDMGDKGVRRGMHTYFARAGARARVGGRATRGRAAAWATCPRLIQSSGAASIMCSAPWCTSSVVTDKAPRLTGRA